MDNTERIHLLSVKNDQEIEVNYIYLYGSVIMCVYVYAYVCVHVYE